MKTSRRVPSFLAAALLLAASASTLPGCPKPDGHQPALVRPSAVVTVVVTYDPATKKAEMDPADKTIKLSERFKDRAQWVSPDGIVRVRFAKESPFEKDLAHEKKILKSINPKKGSAGRSFEYTAELELPDGSRVTIDPRIEVME
jgi:hypothetical protein